MKNVFALLAGLALMACAPPDKPPVSPPEPAAAPPASAAADPAPPTTPTTDDDKCGKSKYAALIGQPETAAGVPPSSPSVRHIHPNTQVTMDYRPDRLNIYINAEGVITELKCT